MIDLQSISIYLHRRMDPRELEQLRVEIKQKLELQPGDEVYFRYESKQDILIKNE